MYTAVSFHGFNKQEGQVDCGATSRPHEHSSLALLCRTRRFPSYPEWTHNMGAHSHHLCSLYNLLHIEHHTSFRPAMSLQNVSYMDTRCRKEALLLTCHKCSCESTENVSEHVSSWRTHHVLTLVQELTNFTATYWITMRKRFLRKRSLRP